MNVSSIILFKIHNLTIITRKSIIINHTLSAITQTIYLPNFEIFKGPLAFYIIKSRSYQPGPRGDVP